MLTPISALMFSSGNTVRDVPAVFVTRNVSGEASTGASAHLGGPSNCSSVTSANFQRAFLLHSAACTSSMFDEGNEIKNVLVELVERAGVTETSGRLNTQRYGTVLRRAWIDVLERIWYDGLGDSRNCPGPFPHDHAHNMSADGSVIPLAFGSGWAGAAS